MVAPSSCYGQLGHVAFCTEPGPPARKQVGVLQGHFDSLSPQQTETCAVSSTMTSMAIMPGDSVSKWSIFSPLSLLLNTPVESVSFIAVANPQSSFSVCDPLWALQRP